MKFIQTEKWVLHCYDVANCHMVWNSITQQFRDGPSYHKVNSFWRVLHTALTFVGTLQMTSRILTCNWWEIPAVNNASFVFLFTARKRSLGQGNIFAPVCHSVHRVVCLSASWDTTPRDQAPPWDQAPCPRTRHPPAQYMLGDTVNKRAVCILLKCNLVSSWNLHCLVWYFHNQGLRDKISQYLKND